MSSNAENPRNKKSQARTGRQKTNPKTTRMGMEPDRQRTVEEPAPSDSQSSEVGLRFFRRNGSASGMDDLVWPERGYGRILPLDWPEGGMRACELEISQTVFSENVVVSACALHADTYYFELAMGECRPVIYLCMERKDGLPLRRLEVKDFLNELFVQKVNLEVEMQTGVRILPTGIDEVPF